mgnify:CR=1 FL=1
MAQCVKVSSNLLIQLQNIPHFFGKEDFQQRVTGILDLQLQLAQYIW